ncbi:MAG: ABC transporter permease, partial [Hyphomicrobiales bacterium]
MRTDFTIPAEGEDSSFREPERRAGQDKLLQKLLRYPSSGALAGVMIVSVLFMFIANPAMFSPRGVLNWVEVSAELTVVAVGACLLVVAGEFDLSIGSMIAFSGMSMALLIVFGGLPAWLAILTGFAVAVGTGFLIGLIRVRSGLPSFIVSLAFLFVLRGASIVSARLFNETTLIGGLQDYKDHDLIAFVFGGQVLGGLFLWMSEHGLLARLPNGRPVVSGVPMIVVWATVLTIAASYVLHCTRFGNWIFATGGDA